MKWTKKENKRYIVEEEKKTDTILGIETEIKGNVIIKGFIKIDGKIEGDVFSDQTVSIGEKGIIKGNINAHNISCSGIVYGNVFCKNKLELLQEAQVYGDIHTDLLTITEGAVFEGNCIMKKQKEALEENLSTEEEHDLFSIEEKL